MKQFTFYKLYSDILDGMNDTDAGKFAMRICEYEFEDKQPEEELSGKERFYWSNISDMLAEVKEAESCGKSLKKFNLRSEHFTFYETYFDAITDSGKADKDVLMEFIDTVTVEKGNVFRWGLWLRNKPSYLRMTTSGRGDNMTASAVGAEFDAKECSDPRKAGQNGHFTLAGCDHHRQTSRTPASNCQNLNGGHNMP